MTLTTLLAESEQYTLPAKKLEILAKRHEQNKKLTECSTYFADQTIQLAWYSCGEHVLEAIGSAGTFFLAKLVNNMPAPLAYALLNTVPQTLRHTSTGLSECILDASTRLASSHAITLLEQVPRIVQFPSISATTFDQWFTNTTLLEDPHTLESYLQLDPLSSAILFYYTTGGTVPQVMKTLKPYGSEACSVLRAICSLEQESPQDIEPFIHYAQTKGIQDVKHKRIFGDYPVLAEILQDYFVAGKTLLENFRRSQAARLLEKTGLSRSTIAQLRKERKERKEYTPLENTVDIYYCIFISALDYWMEAEHALHTHNTEARSLREAHQHYVKTLVNTRAVLRQLLRTSSDADVARDAHTRQLCTLAHKHLGQDHSVTKEITAYTGVAIEKAYFHTLVTRVNQELDEKNKQETKNQDTSLKEITCQREQLNHQRDWWKSVFVTYAQYFKNKHPVFYDNTEQRFVILPEDLHSYAKDCVTEVRAGQTYFTKPTWKVLHA